MTMNGPNPAVRIRKLETLYRAPSCTTCYEHPYRLVVIDEESGEVISETLPESGCSDCGRSILREIQIIGSDVEVP